jgi:hypothetical protein
MKARLPRIMLDEAPPVKVKQVRAESDHLEQGPGGDRADGT